MPLVIRVHSQTEIDLFYSITVSDDGSKILCECGSQSGMCSHIDAVLIANERAMVHLADHAIADAARELTLGKIRVPANWRGAWRRKLIWRGLSGASKRQRNPRESGKPLVCFTGKLPPKERADWISDAVANGWDTTDSPSRFTDVLVAADPTGNSAKLKAARQHRTPIVTTEEWSAVMVDGVLPS